jgi:sacsin
MNNPATSSQLDDDCKKVLQPLISPSLWSTTAWTTDNWHKISKLSVFQCRRGERLDWGYRGDYMDVMATRKRSLKFSEILLLRYLPICWSQTAFPVQEPAGAVLMHIPGRGEPKCITVWRHLAYLKTRAQNLTQDQISDYLSDLRKTYKHLQTKLEISESTFMLGVNAAVWLNLATWDSRFVLLNELQEGWCSISELVLHSSCDAGIRKTVKPGLMEYSQLLAALGCSSVVYPTVTPPELHVGHAISKSLQELRRSGKLLDITFSTQGHRIQAHRLVLAAVSEKCARQFSGVWAVEQVIKFDEMDDPDDFLSYHTLSTMISYAYDDEINWDDMKVLEEDDDSAKEKKLDLLLDLAKGADYWFIPALKSQVETMILAGGRLLIDLKNVEEVKERAELARAAAVEDMCDKFIRQNSHLLRDGPRSCI